MNIYFSKLLKLGVHTHIYFAFETLSVFVRFFLPSSFLVMIVHGVCTRKGLGIFLENCEKPAATRD